MVSVWGLTDKGIVRRENQDSCAYETIPERGLAWGVVCDGMGGAKAGDIASKLAVETFRTHLEDLRGPDLPGETGKLLLAAAEDANRVVYHKASTDDACIGMGTTLVGLILQGETLEVVNVGDSRAYLIRPDGIRRITRDHSVVEDLIANGDLTPEQARRHPQKNLITRALGTSPRVKADLFQETVAPGDALLLCSDGLWERLLDDEIMLDLHKAATAEEWVYLLRCRAMMRKSTDVDNNTAIAIWIKE